MNKKNELLSYSEVMFIIFGSIAGVGIISLPRDVAKFAYEDAWISVAIGGIYPLYMVLIGTYMSRKFPDKNILVLSKKYFGKLFGGILNFIFLSYFIFMVGAITSGYNNLITTFVNGFLSRSKIIIILILLVVYTASKGLKVLGKISVVIFYITILIYISPLPAIRIASILNVKPILDSNFKILIRASLESMYAYAGAETIFLIYPYANDKKRIFSSAVIGVFIAIIIYIWVTFITIYYLGADIVVKSYWPFLSVTESVTVSIVNNFRYIFMFLWTLSVFKVICSDFYMAAFISKDFLKKIDIKILCCILGVVVYYIAFKFGNVVKRAGIIGGVIKYYTTFNIFYVTIIAFIIFLKEGRKR